FARIDVTRGTDLRPSVVRALSLSRPWIDPPKNVLHANGVTPVCRAGLRFSVGANGLRIVAFMVKMRTLVLCPHFGGARPAKPPDGEADGAEQRNAVEHVVEPLHPGDQLHPLDAGGEHEYREHRAPHVEDPG